MTHHIRVGPVACCILFLTFASPAAAQPPMSKEGPGVPLPEGWDYAPAMKKVAARFRGKEGVVVHLGGSMTIANPYGTWARSGKGQTAEDKAILKWMHTDAKDKSDGWWLCRMEVVPYRAHTAESGLKAAMLFDGGKRGLPTLEKILDEFHPCMVTIECGIYDIEDGTPLDDYRKNMAKALDLILSKGAIPILNTIPPFKAQLERTKQFNTALRDIAKERGIPVLDLEKEIFTRRPDDWFDKLMKRIHLTAGEAGVSPGAEPTPENLTRSGYLLRGWLTVRKIAEIKQRVLEEPRAPKLQPTLQKLETNRWIKIHEPAEGELTFRRQPHGGSCFDNKRGRLVLFGSDTHGKDFTNSPLYFDAASLKWSRAYANDPKESYQVTDDGLTVAGSKGNHPWAMHTFGSIVYDPKRDEMIVPIFDEHLIPGRFTDVFKDLWPRIKRKPTWIYSLDAANLPANPGSGSGQPRTVSSAGTPIVPTTASTRPWSCSARTKTATTWRSILRSRPNIG
ncbi:MAG: SGNH/GDSL hydrolase family protein [Planctomycetes bacterium]|nr:SGNH/GDSL hydrolase family protein [Planctomycetota bacterium]